MEIKKRIRRFWRSSYLRIAPIFARVRQKKICNSDFTIISNNCWGGVVYEWYGIKKMSPTVGMYFFADDFLKFISNLKYYLSLDIVMKTTKESRRHERIKELQQIDSPMGLLDDIEVIFLHYKDANVAKEKWDRRRKRVNYDNIIIKFSYMNDCTEEMLDEFDKMKFEGFSPKKIMFVNRPNLSFACSVYYPGYENEKQIYNDTFYFNSFFDLDLFINKGLIKQK